MVVADLHSALPAIVAGIRAVDPGLTVAYVHTDGGALPAWFSRTAATLRQEGEADSLVAFVDQPLEGNYGTWRISSIEPRKVTLSSARGEQIELELEIHDTAMAAPEKPVEEAVSEEADLEPGETQRDSDRPLTRAEEIRQRIAERREELRRAAEEAEAQQADREDRREEARAQDDSESKPLDYRQTIQAMIRGDKPAARENDK